MRIPLGTAESNASGAEYVTDVAYVRTFIEDIAPPRMRLAAALNGFTPPEALGFTYGELGSGQGDTVATLAAACPDARFIGIDLNAEHVAFANGLARRGGLANLRFVEGDFADVPTDELPDFDYLAAHGVLSWIGPEKRRALVDFAARKLKPGGLLYLSYNALPGWAAIEPLRRLLLDGSASVPGTAVDRARHGLALAKLLNDGGAEYFNANPTAKGTLRRMAQAGLPYVVHEYFHTHWTPIYFTDVARELAAGDLHFVGQLPPYLNYRDLTIPPGLFQAFKGIDNRTTFESYKDFALNESFRRDIYIKGHAPCSPSATRTYFDETSFGAPAGRILREVRLPHYTLRFVGPLFDALATVLTARAGTPDELAARPELSSFDAAAIRAALLRLALGDQILPLLRSTEPIAAPGPGPFRVPLAYNRMMLGQPFGPSTLVSLASPIAGTGVALPMAQAVAAHLYTAIEPTARGAWLRAFVTSHTLQLHDGDRPVTAPEEQVTVLGRHLDDFAARRLPELLRLGILEA
jgi:SAM-dependent methyltransferase